MVFVLLLVLFILQTSIGEGGSISGRDARKGDKSPIKITDLCIGISVAVRISSLKRRTRMVSLKVAAWRFAC